MEAFGIKFHTDIFPRYTSRGEPLTKEIKGTRRETAEDRQELEQLDVEGGDGWGGDGSAALAVVVAANDDDFVEDDGACDNTHQRILSSLKSALQRRRDLD